MRKIIIFLIFLIPLITLQAKAENQWRELAPGFHVGDFKVEVKDIPSTQASVTILRIDPEKWNLKLLALSNSNENGCMSVHKWCEKYKMVAGINAGMYATDYSTHIGYMRNGSHINSSKINSYQSVAAFSPKIKGIPRFRIFDTEKTEISRINKQYDCVIQNLRLIKRSGVNRWGQQDKKWSEAALGEDKSGRILFIFCRYPFSMHDFNDMLLNLPVDIVCAQHLEGGPEAQMYLKLGSTELDLTGSFETGFNPDDENIFAFPVPNVIVISKKK